MGNKIRKKIEKRTRKKENDGRHLQGLGFRVLGFRVLGFRVLGF
jgi:hypothetical protein